MLFKFNLYRYNRAPLRVAVGKKGAGANLPVDPKDPVQWSHEAGL